MPLPRSSSPTEKRVATGRLSSLDGLRGLAAVGVMLGHAILMSPRIEQGLPVEGSLLWWVQYTPLKVFSASGEAVTVFFILSGMVLVLPVLRNANFDWFNYFPRRVLRLGVPVAASVLLAAVIVIVHSQATGASVSAWVSTFSTEPLTLNLFVQSLDVFAPYNLMNNPLWTLKWEIIFSLLLPVYVVLAVLTARWWIFGIVVSSILVGIGNVTGSVAFQVLPVFFIGALFAVHSQALLDWAERVRRFRLSGLVWLAALVVSVLFYVLPWWTPRSVWDVVAGSVFAQALPVIGAAGIVLIALLWRPAIGVLTFAPVRWLGRISFSLYLVHVPILVGVANVVGPGRWALTAAVAVPIAVIVAELFTRLVEQPAHRLSKRAGTSASEFIRSKLPVPAQPQAQPPLAQPAAE